jgi:hypothetical protein
MGQHRLPERIKSLYALAHLGLPGHRPDVEGRVAPNAKQGRPRIIDDLVDDPLEQPAGAQLNVEQIDPLDQAMRPAVALLIIDRRQRARDRLVGDRQLRQQLALKKADQRVAERLVGDGLMMGRRKGPDPQRIKGCLHRAASLRLKSF